MTKNKFIFFYACFSCVIPILVICLSMYYGYIDFILADFFCWLLPLNLFLNFDLLKALLSQKRDDFFGWRKYSYFLLFLTFIWLLSSIINKSFDLNALYKISNENNLSIKHVSGILKPHEPYLFEYGNDGYVIKRKDDNKQKIKPRAMSHALGVDIENEKSRLFLRCSVNGHYGCGNIIARHFSKVEFHQTVDVAYFILNNKNLIFSISINNSMNINLVTHYISQVLYEMVIYLILLFCCIFNFSMLIYFNFNPKILTKQA